MNLNKSKDSMLSKKALNPFSFNGKNFFKKKMRKSVIRIAALSSAGVCTTVLAVSIPFALITGLSGGEVCDPSANEASATSVSGNGEDWTKKGTAAYKTAKEVFDHLTKDLGLSGAAAAGVLGNIAHESKFNTSATNSSDGGKGLIQWTFARESQLKEFASKAGRPWTDLGVQIKMLEYDMKQSQNWVSGKYGGQNLVSFGQLDNAEEAASHFYISQMEAGGGYRSDPDGSEGARRSNAKIAYKLFNGSSVKADKSKLEKNAGGGSGSTSKGTDTSEDGDTECNVESGEWAWPFKKIKGKPQISGAQLFGKVGGGRKNGFHDGIDFGTSPYDHSDILAIHGGKVIKIDHEGSTQSDLGWYVVVKSDDGYYTIYQEFAFADSDKDAISVKVGDSVKTGDKIGELDSTKYSGVTHVHIGATKTEINKALAHSFDDDGTWIDWTKLIDK